MKNIRPLSPCTGAGNRSRYVRLVLENSSPTGADMTAALPPYQHHQKRHEKTEVAAFYGGKGFIARQTLEKTDAMGI